MGVKLFALGFEKLSESQAINGLHEDRGRIAYRLCFAVRNSLDKVLELAKTILHLGYTSFVIRSHFREQLIHFQSKHI